MKVVEYEVEAESAAIVANNVTQSCIDVQIHRVVEGLYHVRMEVPGPEDDTRGTYVAKGWHTGRRCGSCV